MTEVIESEKQDLEQVSGFEVLRQYRVVVRLKDGSCLKGVLLWHQATDHPSVIPALPPVLTLRDGITNNVLKVELSKVKAVFFVRAHAGDDRYDEVKFFCERTPRDLWVQVRLADGESLEGRTANTVQLLTEPGFWLWPADFISNNRLVFVPKASLKEFHVMGFAML